MRAFFRGFVMGLVAFGATSPVARAWDTHQTLMAAVLDGLTPELKAELQKPIPAPSQAEDHDSYLKLASSLKLNPSYPVRPTAAEDAPLTSWKVLASPAVDDPDRGIDADLANFYPIQEIDPKGDRLFTGGSSKVITQGLRHLYFAGLVLWHPIATFQFPFRPLGQNPERCELMLVQARALLQSGQTAWGMRTLAYALHYLQDLAQPYHVNQVPDLRMIAWGNLFHGFVKETGRIIYNYHAAFESYVKRKIDRLPCMKPGAPSGDLASDPRLIDRSSADFPERLIHVVIERSRKLAPSVGYDSIEAFGTGLKAPGVDIPHGKGEPPDYDRISSPELDQKTCEALENAVSASRLLLEWALHP